MTILQAIVLGAIQGLTEFLPISSSGHLTIGQKLFGLDPSLSFTVSVHVGTLVAIVVVFRQQVLELLLGFVESVKALVAGQLVDAYRNDEPVRLFVLVFLALFPTAVVGLLVKRYLVASMSSLAFVGLALLVNGGVLFATRWSTPQPAAKRKSGIRDSLAIGLAQGLATMYGISRSGMTISVALFRRLGAPFAISFSFLIAIPAIVAAELLEVIGESGTEKVDLTKAFLGAAVSAVVGYLFLRLLVKVVRRGKLSFFAYYCWLVGTLSLIYHFRG